MTGAKRNGKATNTSNRPARSKSEIAAVRKTIVLFQAFTDKNHLKIKSNSKPADKEMWDRQHFIHVVRWRRSRSKQRRSSGGWPVSV